MQRTVRNLIGQITVETVPYSEEDSPNSKCVTNAELSFVVCIQM
jgi:hypothetical protein